VLVAVLGMHRSGTSAIARALEVVGVALGDRLMPGAKDNEKGFWEDLDVVALNDRALACLGRNWSSLTPVSAEENEALRRAGLVDDAAALLQRRLAAYPRYGFKDPRCARLARMWREAMSRVETPSVAVVTLRHPLSVADSLARRDQLGAERSHLLWLDHTLSCLAATADLPRLVLDFDRLMEDPQAEALRLGALVGAAPEAAALDAFAREFLDERLRHSRRGDDELPGDGGPLSRLLLEVYRALKTVAEGRLDEAALEARVAEWCERFAVWRPILMAADSPNTVEQRLGRLAHERATAAERRQAELQKALDEAQALAGERGESLDRVQAALEEVQSLAQERAGMLDRLQVALEETQTLARERSDAVTASEDRIAGLQAAFQSVERMALERAATIKQHEERIDRLQAAFETIEALALERARALDELAGRLAVADAAVQQLREEKMQWARLYNAVTQTRSWRWTAPLRKLADSVGRPAPPPLQ
jgi:hypothetical protein